MIWTGAELFTVAASAPKNPEPVVTEENQSLEGQLSTFLNEKIDTQDAVTIHDMEEFADNEVALELNDGTISVYCFSEPIKYEDENGETKFKDVTIVEQDDPAAIREGFEYTNGDNDFSIDFSEDVDTGIKISSENSEVSLVPVQREELDKLDGEVKEIVNTDNNTENVFSYEGVFGEGSRIEYSPQLNGLKENIILDQYTGQNTFDFVLNTHGDTAELVNGQIVEIKDSETGEVVNTLLPLFAYDSYDDGEYSTDPAHYTEDCVYTLTEQVHGFYKLTVTVSEEWLTAPTTVYPVTIDPTTITGNDTGMDTALYSAKPDTVYNNPTNNTGYNSTYGKGRAMFKFAMPTAIPTGAKIDGAKYYFRETTAKSDTTYVGAHMINSVANGWSHLVATWNKYYNACDEQLDRRNINSTSTDVSGSPYWYKFDIRAAVQKWINGQATNRGIMLVSESEGTTASWRAWASIRHGTSSYKPYANIMYTEDKTAPVITVTQTPTAWTNGNVTLTVSATDVGGGVKEYSFDNDAAYSTSVKSKTYSANASVTIKVRDYAGNTTTKTVSITNIDKTLPTITSVTKSPTAWTNGNVTLTVNATDTGSGVSKYYFDGVENTAGKSKTYTANKTGIKVTVKDAAGNVSLVTTVDITNIDKTAPTINSVTGFPEKWTNAPVTLTVNATDTQSGLKDYSFDGGKNWQTTKTKTFNNGEYADAVIQVRDNASNVAKYGEEIPDLPDRTPPSITLSSSNIYSNSATINTTITDEENGVAVRKWVLGNQAAAYFNGGGTELSRNSFAVTQSGTYTVFAQDEVGNSSVKTIQITLTPQSINEPGFTVNDGILTITYPENAQKKLYREGNGLWKPYTVPLILKDGFDVHARAFIGNTFADRSYLSSESAPQQNAPAIAEKDGLVALFDFAHTRQQGQAINGISNVLTPDSAWLSTADRSMKISGSEAIASNLIGDDETTSTTAIISVPENAVNGAFSFYYNLSTEVDADFFLLYLDGVCILSDSGEVDWTLFQKALTAGDHTIQFEYKKNKSNHKGLDKVFIDGFKVTYEYPADDHGTLEYKIDDSPWMGYEEPFEIERNRDVTVQARTNLGAGGYSPTSEKTFFTYVGGYTEQVTDMSIETPGLTLDISRTYNSNGTLSNGNMPKDWFYFYDTRVEDYAYSYYDPSGDLASVTTSHIKTYYDMDGSRYEFFLGQNGEYTSPWIDAVMTVDTNRTTVTMGDGYKYVYQSSEETSEENSQTLVSIIDKNGNETKFRRAWFFMYITDSAGRIYACIFFGGADEDYISLIQDPEGESIEYKYNGDGELINVVKLAKMEYDESGVPINVLNQEKISLSSYEYNADGSLSKINSTGGQPVKTISYDSVGRISSVDYPNGSREAYTYFGNSVTVTDKNGFTESLIYDNRMRPAHSTDMDGKETKYTYTTNGSEYVATETTDGKLTRNIYDEKTKLLKKVEHPETDGTIPTEVYTYDSNNRVIREKTTDNKYTFYTYDTWGKLISITGNKTLGELNPYRYRGYRYDTETGLYYLQSRYYDPEIGRFISADSIEDTGHRP